MSLSIIFLGLNTVGLTRYSSYKSHVCRRGLDSVARAVLQCQTSSVVVNWINRRDSIYSWNDHPRDCNGSRSMEVSQERRAYICPSEPVPASSFAGQTKKCSA